MLLQMCFENGVSIMIELKNVSKYYNTNSVAIALKNINLNLDDNEIVAITGESGSGKTTLLNIICSVDNFSDGEMIFNGKDITYFNQNDRDLFRKKYISFIYQSYNLIDSYTVLENVMAPLLLRGYNKKEVKEKALKMIKDVNLENKINERASFLSGGEKQRASIARALMTDAKIIACDEPTANLDEETGKEIIDLIKKLAVNRLVLIVTHNFNEVKDIATRKIVLSDGEIIEDSNNLKEINETKYSDTDLDLVEEKPKKKIVFNFAFKNLIRTPRKSIFSLIVMIILGIFVFFSYFMAVYLSTLIERERPSNYVYTISERIILNDNLGINSDMINELNEYEYYINPIYEDALKIDIIKRIDNYPLLLPEINSITYHMPENIQNKSGNLGDNSDDCFIILPSNDFNYYSKFVEILDTNILIDLLYYKQSLRLTGVAISDEVSGVVLVLNKDSVSFNEMFLYKDKISYMRNDKFIKVNLIYDNVNKIVLNGIKKKDYSSDCFYYNDIYNMKIDDVDIEENDGSYESIDIHFKDNLFEFNKIYDLSVYIENNESDLIKILDKYNCNYFKPYNVGINTNSINYYFTILYGILFTVVVLAFSFISYTIIGRVYSSKNNIYSILRQEGLMKKEMKKVINFELLLLGIIASILSFVISICIILSIPSISYLLKRIMFWFIFVYFIFMVILSYLISVKYNKRLFEFSINASFKGDDLND